MIINTDRYRLVPLNSWDIVWSDNIRTHYYSIIQQYIMQGLLYPEHLSVIMIPYGFFIFNKFPYTFKYKPFYSTRSSK